MIQPTTPEYCGAGALFGVPTPNGDCASAASIAPAATITAAMAAPAISRLRLVRPMVRPRCAAFYTPWRGSGTFHQDAVGELCAEQVCRIELLVGRHLEQLGGRGRDRKSVV